MAFCIVETVEDNDTFCSRFLTEDCIISAIPADTQKHACDNEVCIFACYFFKDDTSYILSVNHPDAFSMNIGLGSVIGGKKYVFNKKDFCHLMGVESDSLIDIDLMLFLSENKTINYEKHKTKCHGFISNKFYQYKNLNRCIPLVKHAETFESQVKAALIVIRDHADLLETDYFSRYNNDVIDTYRNIEINGIHVDRSVLQKHFGKSGKHVTPDDLVYTQYFIYNPTGRPSNRFGKINYSALNKETGCRKSFTSRYDGGKIVLIDYESFHFRLISDYINYDFPKDIYIHEYLGGDKIENFHTLFNGPKGDLLKNPFWKKIDQFVKYLWIIFTEEGHLPSPRFKRPILPCHCPDAYPYKLFNYYIQNMEAETAAGVSCNLHKFLVGKRTKLIQYMYDAFIFDIHPDEMDLIQDFKKIMECGGRFPCKVEMGENLHDLKLIN